MKPDSQFRHHKYNDSSARHAQSADNDYDEDSELSAYSPPEEAKGLFQNKYQNNQPPSEFT
jgi:hypothetical protein